jgi:DNA polymerase V
MTTGFPNPALDYLQSSLDLNSYLIRRPAATFFMQVEGSTMLNSGIYPSDLLIVDRSLEPINNSIVIVVLDGELSVRRFIKKGKDIFLAVDNPEYKEILIDEYMDFNIWGVVTTTIHNVLPK